MPHPMLCAALLAGTLWAGPLRFSPDTVCQYGTSTCPASTEVQNTSKDSVTIQLTTEISTFATANEFAFSWYGNSHISVYVGFNSGVAVSSGYALTANSYTEPLGGLKTLDSALLSSFQVGSCMTCTALASTEAALPDHLGNGEIIAIVFASTPGGSDTLHLKVTQWTQGGSVLPRSSLPSGRAVPRFTADGKATARHSDEVLVGPDGAQIDLH